VEAISRYKDIIESELAQDVIDYGSEPCLRALHVVARAGEVQVAKMLVQKKANVNFPTSKGLSPLHYAVLSGKVAMVRLLLLYGAKVNYQSTRDGRTCLYTAAEKGHLEVVRFLVEHGGNPSIRSFSGMLPKEAAAENGHCQIQALLEDQEKRQHTMTRPTSDYDIAAYMLGSPDDPFLQMTRSIDELFPKVSARRRSADTVTVPSMPSQSATPRSESFIMPSAPPIYEEDMQTSQPSSEVLDLPPSYEEAINQPSLFGNASYSTADDNDTTALLGDEDC